MVYVECRQMTKKKVLEIPESKPVSRVCLNDDVTSYHECLNKMRFKESENDDRNANMRSALTESHHKSIFIY